MTNDPSLQKRTVRTQRRRRASTPPAQRETAAAPRRERPSSGGGGLPPRPPSGPLGPSGPSGYGGGGLPTGGGGGLGGGLAGGLLGGLLRSPIGIVIILGILFFVFVLPMFRGGDTTSPGDVGVVQPTRQPTRQPTQAPAGQSAGVGAAAQPTPRPTPTRAAVPAAPAAGATPGQKWLVMLYQDADDKVLEKDIFFDMNEAERVGSSDRVQIVSQIDRFRGGYQADGNWDGTRRYYVRQDNDLERVSSELVQDLGESNMADGNALVDFVTWAMQTYPADKHVLILSDHGMGWPGGWSDPTAQGGADRTLPISSVLGDQLYLSELEQALAAIRQRTGVDKLELIGLDACLMGHLEVLSALAPYARYAVASQETEPGLGWAYAAFLDALQQNPDITGAELGKLIVDSYVVDDQRIVDDQARAEFVGRGNALEGLFGILGGPTADQVASQLAQNITLTAADLGALPALMDSVNTLAYSLQGVDPRAVAKARSYTQSFTSIFGDNIPPSYIDLGHFAQLAAQAGGDQSVAQAADAVMAALGQVVLAEKHGPQRPGATGVSVYFPNSQLYESPLTGPQSYLRLADRFAADSLWDDYLDFHYTGRHFEAAPAAVQIPERIDNVSAPGQAAISIGPIEASASTAAPGQPVLLRADVSGEAIGYIKLLVGYLDREANSINVIDMDYLESPETHELNGVYYPDWGEGSFALEFEWEPVVFGVSNGEDTGVALFTPESYGATYRQATYVVDGTYNFADGSPSRSARLYFQDRLLRQVFSFTGENEMGAPWEIVPEKGDTFTIAETWMDLDANGQVVEVATQAGQTLTFGDKTFSWEDLNAAAGEYVVGFIVEDLDGNQQASYTAIRVE